MIDKIHQNGEMYFYQEEWQVVGLSYEFEDQTYIITATAYDQYAYNKLDTLYQTISIVFICSILQKQAMILQKSILNRLELMKSC